MLKLLSLLLFEFTIVLLAVAVCVGVVVTTLLLMGGTATLLDALVVEFTTGTPFSDLAP